MRCPRIFSRRRPMCPSSLGMGSAQAPIRLWFWWCFFIINIIHWASRGGGHHTWCKRSEKNVGFPINTEKKTQKPNSLGFPFVSMKPKVLLKPSAPFMAGLPNVWWHRRAHSWAVEMHQRMASVTSFFNFPHQIMDSEHNQRPCPLTPGRFRELEFDAKLSWGWGNKEGEREGGVRNESAQSSVPPAASYIVSWRSSYPRSYGLGGPGLHPPQPHPIPAVHLRLLMGWFGMNQIQLKLKVTDCHQGLIEWWCPDSVDSSKIRDIGWRTSFPAGQCVKKRHPLYTKIFKRIYI